MNIGEKIKELRQRHHMTQDALALRLCVSAQAISKWERGVSNPDLYLVPRLAEVFDISADELLGLSQSANAERAVQAEYLSRLEFIEQQMRILTAATHREVLDTLLKDCKVRLRFDFTTMPLQEKRAWTLRNAVPSDDRSGFCFRSVAIDRPAVGSDYQPYASVASHWKPQVEKTDLCLDFSRIERIRLHLRSTVDFPNATLHVFFQNDTHTSWSKARSVSCQYQTGEWVELQLSIPSADWRDGCLTGLRINPTERYLDACELELIELLDAHGEAVYSYRFEGASALGDWTLQNAVLQEGTSRFVLTAPCKRVYDPGMVREGLYLPIDNAQYLHVRLRNDPADRSDVHVQEGWTVNGQFYNALLGVYFKTEANPVYSTHRRVCEAYVSRSGMIDLYVNMTSNSFWKGTLTGLRIDPCEMNYAASFHVELIELLEARVDLPPVLLFELQKRINSLESLQYRLDEMDWSTGELDRKVDRLEKKMEELTAKVEALLSKNTKNLE